MNRKITWMVLAWLACLALLAGIANADTLPVKSTGHVYDGGGMFPSSQLTALEKASAAGNPYTFYVVTIEALGQSEPDAYAETLYQSWKLRADDVLILLARDERRIQLYFENPPLQKKLDALPDNYAGDSYLNRPSIDRFVGKQFTPSAKAGDYAAGILNMIAEMKNLPEPQPDPDQPIPQVKPATPPASTHTVTDPYVPAPQTNAKEGSMRGLITLIVVGCVLAFLALFIRYTVRKFRKARMIREAEQVALQLFRVQEKLNPLVALYSGPAAERGLKPLSESVDSRSAAIQHIIQSLRSLRPGFFLSKEVKEMEQLAETYNTYRTEAAEFQQEAEALEELDRSNGLEVAATQKALQAVTVRAEELAQTYSMSLARIQLDIAANAQQVQEIHSLQVTDLINAAEKLKPNQERLRLHNTLLDQLPELLAQQQQLPDDIEQTRRSIEEQLRAEQLLQHEFQPYDKLSEASRRLAPYGDALSDGDLESAARLLAEMTDAMAAAKEMVRARIALRDGIDRDLHTLEAFVRGYDFNEAVYREELTKLQSQFHESVWSFMPNAYRKATEAFQAIQSGIIPARQVFQRQKYIALRDEVDHWLELSKIATEAADSCMNARQLALAQLEQLRSKRVANWQAYQSSLSLITAHQLPVSSGRGAHLSGLDETIQSQFQQIDRLLSPPLIHLESSELLLKQLAGQVESYAQDVQRLITEKRDAEARMREINSRYNSVYSRASRSSMSGQYNASYQTSMNDVQRMFMLGMYAEAINRMNDAEQSIHQMQWAYDAMVHEERRREEQQRQEEQQRRDEDRRRQEEHTRSSSTGGDNFNHSRGSSGGDSW